MTTRSCSRRRCRHALAVAVGALASLGPAGCGGSSPPRPEPAAARLGSWSETGTLLQARGGQTESTLPDGKVLVTGGQTGDVTTALKVAEVFDPATGKWAAAPDMSGARTGHIATVLADGRVLVTGGLGFNTAEIYDPTARTWSPAGTMSTKRLNHTATLLPDGRVVVVGGFEAGDTPGLTSVDVYDPATNAWSPTAPLAGGRGLHTANLLSTGKVLIAAGNDLSAYRRTAADATSTTVANALSSNSTTGKGEIATAELYDPASGTWTATAPMRTGRSAHTATTLKDGKVLAVGGFNPDGELDSVELYDPTTGSWSAAAALTSPRTVHAAALLPDGQVLVTGGQLGNSGSILSSALPIAAVYDPAAAKWRPAAEMTTPRTGHSATVLADGKILVVGGLNPNGPVGSSELFTLEAKAKAKAKT